ncbi:hypothetical protein GR160_04555 [Flavobacterium sp. Sd200]|uniref:hypothetical protein n=1 Tax=Flavobacterium sp. Sd200 TaxID=2692211 RepID=UPI001369CEC7|nr:hypothetical protein [Flavobacterium sp. Sd200]MXN90490.1 hypothetical protein [Flavobacterium sp. Sd200]
MKNIAIAILFATGLAATAQVNQNVTKESTTTTVKVNDGSGKTKKLVKTNNTESVNQIQIKDADSKKLNKESVEGTPVVTTSTTVERDNGFNARVGQISNYQMGGNDYIFVTEKAGYRIATPDNKDYAKVRKTSNGQYIYRTGTSTSVGYFNASGDFVVETYDDKTDGMTVETYTKVQK